MSGFNLYSRGDKVFGVVNATLLTLFVLSTLYPFIYIAASSISSGLAVTSGDVLLLPKDITFAAYDRVLSDPVFWTSYANTLFYTIFGTLVSLAIIIPGAYALSRKRLIGRRYLNFFVAFTMWFHAGMIPFFLNIRDLGLLDSRIGILIAFACTAFNIILLRNFFESIPESFEEAAKMDGANEFTLLWKVYIPLSKPALVTIALFCIVARWNGYFWAMVLLRDEDKIPLQVYLKKIIIELNMDDQFASSLINSDYSFETIVAAIIVASIIPVLAVYPYLQKHFNKGIMMGGVKE
ncbi:sugar ABC transporter permease [Marinobacterium aestuarii]|uniref:Sugar ABC transporter permease n=1 Tax=Marinobacterium aestuarii TaxID=1821621 RepID=A0A1A9EU45_9GAMM|nr:carbohydrate ABC transporter permease [Marinobacterium aestuarii]ANG61405.1 sugar ABC transporter permease [Marinobacterium aestuarii]